VEAVDVDDASVDSPVVTESEGEDDFGSEEEQAGKVASEEESEEEIDGQFDADGAQVLPNLPASPSLCLSTHTAASPSSVELPRKHTHTR
jgi:hypothetical protein